LSHQAAASLIHPITATTAVSALRYAAALRLGRGYETSKLTDIDVGQHLLIGLTGCGGGGHATDVAVSRRFPRS
jgi:hypothetical protein